MPETTDLIVKCRDNPGLPVYREELAVMTEALLARIKAQDARIAALEQANAPKTETAEPSPAEKVRIAKAWGKVHGKWPIHSIFYGEGPYLMYGWCGIWTCMPRPCDLPIHVFNAIIAVETSCSWKILDTEEAAYVALYDALKACNELPTDAATETAEVKAERRLADETLREMAARWTKDAETALYLQQEITLKQCAAELEAWADGGGY